MITIEIYMGALLVIKDGDVLYQYDLEEEPVVVKYPSLVRPPVVEDELSSMTVPELLSQAGKDLDSIPAGMDLVSDEPRKPELGEMYLAKDLDTNVVGQQTTFIFQGFPLSVYRTGATAGYIQTCQPGTRMWFGVENCPATYMDCVSIMCPPAVSVVQQPTRPILPWRNIEDVPHDAWFKSKKVEADIRKSGKREFAEGEIILQLGQDFFGAVTLNKDWVWSSDKVSWFACGKDY